MDCSMDVESLVTEFANVLVEIDGAVATITLNRPERLNAISEGLRDDLESALRELNPGDAVRVIRLRAAGRAFCAGYDITPNDNDFAYTPSGRTGDQAWELGESMAAMNREHLRDSIERWLWIWSYRKPIIAQVHGWCLAGGNDLVGSCDIIFATQTARFGHPAGRALGQPPTLGMWPAKIGMLKTKELLFSGDTIDGVEAERIGMINRVYPEESLDAETMAYCQRIAQVPIDGLTVHKHATNRWFELTGQRMSAIEGAEFNAIFAEAPTIAEFGKISRSKGLKAALEWRDDPFGDGRGAVRREK